MLPETDKLTVDTGNILQELDWNQKGSVQSWLQHLFINCVILDMFLNFLNFS